MTTLEAPSTEQQRKRGPKPCNETRDEFIRQLRTDGMSLQAIADRYDISRQRIHQIVNE